MADGTSFIAGASVAALAVIVLFRGGGSLTASPPAVTQQIPIPAVPPPITSLQSPGNSEAVQISSTVAQLKSQLDQQNVLINQYKVQLEQQRAETERLKGQLQSQKTDIEAVNSKTIAQSLNQAASQDQPASKSALQGLIWAAGGMAMTVVGGAVLTGMVAVMSRQQHHSSAQKVEVIHSHDATPLYTYMTPRAKPLPAPTDISMVEPLKRVRERRSRRAP